MNKWRDKFWSKEHIVRIAVLSNLPKNQRGITKVYFVKDLGGTPARCLRSTGECWISLKDWKKSPYEHKVFILLHENAHIFLDTSDELKVDALAHKQYLAMGFSLTSSITALTKVLSYSMPEHLTRTREQMVRATVYDITVNGNNKLKRKLLQIKSQNQNK